MGWTEVRNALQAAVVTASGLASSRVIWRYQNAPAPALDYVALHLASVREVGRDGIGQDQDLNRAAGTEIALSIAGVREAVLSVQAFSSTLADSSDALATAEKIRSGLRLPTVRAALAAQLVVPFDSGSVQYVPEVVAAGFRGRAVLDVNIALPAIAAVDYLGYIATVGGTLTTSGGAGVGSTATTLSLP